MKDVFITDIIGKSVKVVFGKTRVVLVNEGFSAQPYDPVWDSEHSCVGTVIEYYNGLSRPILVRWDRGTHTNNYATKDLRIHRQKAGPNPNMSFKRKKEKTEKPFKFGDAPLKPKSRSKDVYTYDEGAFVKHIKRGVKK